MGRFIQPKKILFSLLVLIVISLLIFILPNAASFKTKEKSNIEISMNYGVKSSDTSKNNFNYPQNDIKLDWNRTFQFPNTRKAGTIFVSIASYRDPRCPESLRTMFNGAEDPTKVFVGIVQQNKDEDMDCLEAYCILMTSEKKNCLRENISVIRMSATETRGVVVIRHMVSTMYQGEEFFLQIDAHSVFMEGWDQILKNQLKMVDYDRVVLSWHPPAFEVFESMGKKAKHMIVNLCVFNWDAHGLPRFSGQLLNGMNDRIKKPFPGIFVGAGGVFGRADFLKDCPFDPNYPSMFSGEELLMSACLFTYGWDIYNPSLSVIFHKYKDASNNVPVPVHWDNTLGSVQRLKFQLGVADKKPDDKWLVDVDKFKMGSVRPLSTYYEYGGVDWAAKKGDNLPFCNFRSEKIYHVNHPPGIEPLPVL